MEKSDVGSRFSLGANENRLRGYFLEAFHILWHIETLTPQNYGKNNALIFRRNRP